MTGSTKTSTLGVGLHTLELGEVYYDKVSGFTGVAVSYTVYLDDPIRTVELEAHTTDSGRSAFNFSELRLERTKPNSGAGQYL